MHLEHAIVKLMHRAIETRYMLLNGAYHIRSLPHIIYTFSTKASDFRAEVYRGTHDWHRVCAQLNAIVLNTYADLKDPILRPRYSEVRTIGIRFAQLNAAL